jgi:hypothetical protein
LTFHQIDPAEIIYFYWKGTAGTEYSKKRTMCMVMPMKVPNIVLLATRRGIASNKKCKADVREASAQQLNPLFP